MIDIKVALVHDHLTMYGGAERVLRALHTLFPDAPIYTLFADDKIVQRYFPHAEVRTSFLNGAPPFFQKRFRFLSLFAIPAIESFDLSEFNVVISSSAFFAKGVVTDARTLHISYCHTPLRRLWNIDGKPSHSNFYAMFTNPFLHFLRMWDVSSASRVDAFLANSENVQKRIQKFYGRNSAVVYPPCAKKTELTSKYFGEPYIPDKFFLIVSSLMPHKRIDVAVQAFQRLKYPLVIIGSGPDGGALRKYASKNTIFLGYQPEGIVAEYYKRCVAFIHTAEEDFGISMVEALLYGKPVLAFAQGGSREIIQPGKNGLFFEAHDPCVLADGVRRIVDAVESGQYDPESIKADAERFSYAHFSYAMKDVLKKELSRFLDVAHESHQPSPQVASEAL